jgi:hypothetical protein
MARPLRLAGALAVLASLWLPWYGLSLGDELRGAIDREAAQLPQGFGEFARGLLEALPSSFRVTGWHAFEGADVALALLAAAAVVSLALEVDPRAVMAAGAAIAGLVLIHLLDQPGPNEIVSVKVGPWVALVGGVAIAASAWPPAVPAAPEAPAAWAPPASAPPASAPASVSPPP